MERFLKQLKKTPLGEGIVYHQRIPAREARWDRLSFSLPAALREGLEQKGLASFYCHQVEALEALQRGEHTIVATPTASGKTLIYALTCLKKLLENQLSKSLFLFPIKALEQDQRKTLEEWAPFLPPYPGGLTAIYDGDTPPSARKKIRQKPPPVVISNPDMLHLGLLPFHETWKEFFKNLKLVVIDEAHTYKGILGSHVVQIVRRLRRICRLYGSEPQFVLSSATIARPEDFSRALAGLPFTVVQESGFPSPAKHFLFINPDISPAVVASRLFSHCLAKGKKTILFTQGRRQTELIHKWVAQMAPELKEKVSSYRAGFLPEERRVIEQKLSSGELLGVISTSALELGIDIGSLDVCILVGYPGSIINTWQRGGRVGRSQQESAIFFVAQPDALDQYFIRHPENFFERGFEAAVVDPGNSPILKAHLVCAAAELPLSAADPFFTPEACGPELTALEKEGRLLRNAAGDGWISRRKNPQREVNIRSVGESYTIMEGRQGRVIGTVDGVRAFRECHPGAIYLHRAVQFLVEELDLFEKNIYVKPREVNYYTRIQAQKETEIIEKEKVRPVGNFLINFGRVLVTETFTGYEKRAIYGQELLGAYPLELPSLTFETRGLWIEVEEALQEQLKASHFQVMGSLHALEHGAISMFPLYALCDRGDIGGICYVRHPQVEKGAIFIYDGVPGGVGLAERGFEIIEDLLQRTSDLIAECDCEEGCPSCIHSPQCGSGNKPLDKAGARYLTQLLLGQYG
ncbi:MAG: DEAD/DEAH box helicase, partial [Desulfobacterota bacterium]|nr:DEAD/DEAH box helicase [Thermodesulfobacteriota bacterium]